MKMLRWAALPLSALHSCVPALAATQPAFCANSYGQTIACPPAVLMDKTGVAIDSGNPLPTSPTIAAATSVEVSNTPAIGTTILGPFAPQLGRDLRVVISGTGWAGTVTIGTSSTAEACTTFNPLTAGGQVYASFTANANEAVDTPTLAGVVYCAREVITTAGATVRVRQ